LSRKLKGSFFSPNLEITQTAFNPGGQAHHIR
jgi:hypothetical protein